MVKQATSGTVNILFVLFDKFYNCEKQAFDFKKQYIVSFTSSQL